MSVRIPTNNELSKFTVEDKKNAFQKICISHTRHYKFTSFYLKYKYQ